MGLTDGHLVWGDDIPTESEKTYYRQIANLEKENARLLEECEAYKKAIEDIKSEIGKNYDGIPYNYSDYNNGMIDALEWVLDVIDERTNGEKMENE